MNLEKIYPSTDTGAQAIGKLERNQNMLNQGIISNENKINVLNDKCVIPNEERTTNTKPDDYKSGFRVRGLKNADAVGLGEYGMYAHIVGYNTWNDNTAFVHEVAFVDGNILLRKNLSIVESDENLNKWGEWEKLSTTNRPVFTSDRDTTGGGEILLEKPKQNTNLIENVRIDVCANEIRFFEDGNGYRGAHIKIENCKYGVNTQLATVDMLTELQTQINAMQEMLVNMVKTEG